LGAALPKHQAKNMTVNVNKYQGFETMPINQSVAKQKASPKANRDRELLK
jgi:hypothetical protein